MHVVAEVINEDCRPPNLCSREMATELGNQAYLYRYELVGRDPLSWLVVASLDNGSSLPFRAPGKTMSCAKQAGSTNGSIALDVLKTSGQNAKFLQC